MTSQPRGPYKTGIESRRRLVENAIRVFGEHGYRGGSLRMIAEAVGASASQIINLFGSKHELLTAVLDRWDEQQVEVGEEAREGLAYVDTLRERIRYSHDNPTWVEFFLTLGSEATGQDHPAHDYVVERYDHITNRLQEEILRAAAAGEIAPMEAAAARAEAQQLSAMMDGLQLQWLLDPSVDLVGTFDRYLDVVVERWRTGTAPATP